MSNSVLIVEALQVVNEVHLTIILVKTNAVDFYNSSWNGPVDFAFELPSLSYVSDVYFLL